LNENASSYSFDSELKAILEAERNNQP
jgi:hypothetical protein